MKTIKTLLVNTLFKFLFIEKLKYKKHELSAQRGHGCLQIDLNNCNKINHLKIHKLKIKYSDLHEQMKMKHFKQLIPSKYTSHSNYSVHKTLQINCIDT